MGEAAKRSSWEISLEQPCLKLRNSKPFVCVIYKMGSGGLNGSIGMSCEYYKNL